MIKISRILLLLTIQITSIPATGQVDTSFIFNENTPYGTLDLRIARTESNYFYLKEGTTFSFRTQDGKRTNTFLPMTAWDSGPYQQGQLREKSATDDRFVMNYRLLLPENMQNDTKYPIVFFLHGIQESGNCVDETCLHGTREYDPNENNPPAPQDADNPLYNNDYNLLHGGRNYLNARNRAGGRLVNDPALHTRAFPGFALFPQSNNGWSPSEVESALRLLRLIMKKYNIDEDRVYINGLSRGGYGAFEAMKRAPWLFAAGALFSPISDANIISLDLEPTIQHIPLWIFQGGQDLAPLPKDTEGRIRNLQRAGMSVRYTLYPHLGHATWNEAMEEPDFFSWLLGYNNTRIHAFGGTEVVCQSDDTGLTLTLSPGYKEYEWQLNQKTIRTSDENFLVVSESGVYRARYRFTDTNEWNDWSKEITIGIGSLDSARFVQHGTLHLQDLNGKNEAVLEAQGDYNEYHWYRYEDRVNLAGDADDSMKTATIESSHGSGYFSLRVANYGGCESPPSESKKIFFNGKSPVNISRPEALAAEGKSVSEVILSWKDNSDNEEAFEIWRRKGSGQWVLASITKENVQSFTDSGLQPSSRYEYKIRAVSNYGRSEYLPGGGSGFGVETPADNTPPAAPPNLDGELADVNTIMVHWNSATDDSSIKGYVLYVDGKEIETGSIDTVYWLQNLTVNTLYTLQVAAVDAGNNIGEKSAPLEVSTEMTGLFYKHTTGAWQDLKSIDWSIVEYRGRVHDFTLSPKTQEDFFNFRFDGFLYIEKAGSYQFRLGSNDGSRLRLNDTLAVNNDGVHDLEIVTGSARKLNTGPQRITVHFFDFMSADSLIVEYAGPDTNEEWTVVDSHVLKSLMEPSDRKLEFSIYPNPAVNGMTNVTLRGGGSTYPVGVTISNAMGRKVREYIFDELGKSAFVLPDLTLDNGVYIITVTQGSNSNTKRLVVTW